MITEQQLRDEAVKRSDSRLNGHDVSSFVEGAKWICKQLNVTDAILRSELECTKQDCCCEHRQNNKCGLLKCQYNW